MQGPDDLCRNCPVGPCRCLTRCASAPKEASSSDYIAVGDTNVTTTCGGGYQVYRQPANGGLLVAAYAASEMRQSFCPSWRVESSVSPVTSVRHEEAAPEFIAQAPAMKGCALASGIEITRLHSGFAVACPALPAAAIPAKGSGPPPTICRWSNKADHQASYHQNKSRTDAFACLSRTWANIRDRR
jgi:hypothetical protein